MAKKIKLIVHDWGHGKRCFDKEGNLCPNHQEFIVYENEVEEFIWNDYDARLACAPPEEREFVTVRSAQKILSEFDNREYNNDRRHERGKERLVKKIGRYDPIMRTREESFETELERSCLPKIDQMMTKMNPSLTATQKEALWEVILSGHMDKKKFAERHHVTHRTVRRWVRKILDVSGEVLQDEIKELMEY